MSSSALPFFSSRACIRLRPMSCVTRDLRARAGRPSGRRAAYIYHSDRSDSTRDQAGGRAGFSVQPIRIIASTIRLALHSGHLPGLASRSGPNSKPHALQRAGRISMRSPRAAADRSMCRRSSSTSPRPSPSSRASDDTDRHSAVSNSCRCRRSVTRLLLLQRDRLRPHVAPRANRRLQRSIRQARVADHLRIVVRRILERGAVGGHAREHERRGG